MQSATPVRLLQRASRAQAITQLAPLRSPGHLHRGLQTAPLNALLTRLPYAPMTRIPVQARLHSTNEQPLQRPLTDRNDPGNGGQDLSDADTIAMRKALSPAYQLWITCKKCLERSSHTISKQAYHFGSCVLQCPKCKSKHLISDNLKIFSDTNMTMEDIAKEHGEKLRKGRLGADGDIEFYDESATTKVS